MSLGLALVLGTQFVLLVVIVWFAYRSSQPVIRGNHCPSNTGTAGAAEGAKLQELLTAASKVLTEHADELEVFEHSLDAHAAEQRDDASSLARHVEQIRRANKNVEQTIDSTIAGLINACADLLSSEQSNLEAYQKKTSALDTTLAGLNQETLLAGIASKLLDMVHELRDENKAIRDDVAAAKDKTIEFMTRAHAAEQDARVDPLTQLPNRRAFDEAHAACDDALKRHGQPYCLILIDIDHFKLVNDRHGHSAGDAILSMIGRVLRESRRTSDQVCRLGGEEFALLLPQCEEEPARLVAERFRRKIEAAVLGYRNQQLSVTVSCGVAQVVSGESRSRLLQRADSAMYAAKLRGRNQTCLAREVESQETSPIQQAATR
ncbi:MAG: sensor domain-containing diguanylate cyclase [Planctomycetota bacterium]|jgi:diguanylate cyclase (GGDEF)-like protein